MKIKEVCEKTGLTDRAVRHYIRSGLVFPKYNENYTGRKNFNFCDGDVIRLKEIAVLRKYDLSLESITSVSDNAATLSCTVAEDYSSIKYYNDKFIPIDLGELSCAKAEILDEAPDFENKDDKNIFERFIYMIVNYCTVYAVKNTYNNSMIMIDSEFISDQNRYYVNEKYYKYYKNLSDSYSPESLCLSILNFNGDSVNVSLNDMTDYLNTIAETSNEIDYNISALSAIEVNALDKSGIFYKTVGSINQCGDDYYYIDYNDYEKDKIPAYKIDSSYNKYLDEQFDFYNWLDNVDD